MLKYMSRQIVNSMSQEQKAHLKSQIELRQCYNNLMGRPVNTSLLQYTNKLLNK